MLGQLPGDTQCSTAESTFYGYVQVQPYLLLVALGGMVVGFIINLVCECGKFLIDLFDIFLFLKKKKLFN